MIPLRVCWSRVRGLLGSRRRDAELDEELTTHPDALTADYVRRGLTAAEARAAARRDFGGVEQMKEVHREQRGLPALAIAGVGLYGVVAYSVAQRTSEIGIRIALGAEPQRVGTMVLKEGLAIGGTGVIAGMVSAAALVRALTALLYGVKPGDPASFGAAGLGLLLISAAASDVPARTASRVDPMVALRAEQGPKVYLRLRTSRSRSVFFRRDPHR